MRLYIILRIKLETLPKKKKVHQFKTLYFFQRPWAFNHKQKAISSACTKKSGSSFNYVTIGTIEGNIASRKLTFGTFLINADYSKFNPGQPRSTKVAETMY